MDVLYRDSAARDGIIPARVGNNFHSFGYNLEFWTEATEHVPNKHTSRFMR